MVTAIDAQGQPTDAPTLWSSAPTVATLDGNSVTGITPGTTFIQYGTAAGRITVATIVVVPRGTSVDESTPASIAASPSLIRVPLGGTGPIHAEAYSIAGTPVASTLTYTSANPDVARVDVNGTVTGVAAGFAAISVSLTTQSAGADAGDAPDAGTPTISATVMVEVLTSGGEEPGATGSGCGAQPVPTYCTFQHGSYNMLVGVAAQIEPVEVTYMCPFSKGFSTAGQWTTSSLVGPNPSISQSGVLGPLASCGGYTVNFSAPGTLKNPCTATAYVWGQPNWSGDWTCTNTGMSGNTTTGQLTGVPRDSRAICPENDPSCCVFDSTNSEKVDTSASPVTCTPEPPDKNLQGWGPDTACTPTSFSYTGSAFVGDSCEKGRKYDCGGGADAGADASTVPSIDAGGTSNTGTCLPCQHASYSCTESSYTGTVTATNISPAGCNLTFNFNGVSVPYAYSCSSPNPAYVANAMGGFTDTASSTYPVACTPN